MDRHYVKVKIGVYNRVSKRVSFLYLCPTNHYPFMSIFRFIFSKTFVKQLILAAVVLVVLIFVVKWWLGSTTNHDERIAVPNIKGMTLDLVDQELENADLRYFIIDSANYNPDYPKYSVIEQDPEAGKFVKENRQIYLVLNPSGFRKITVPENLIGRTRRQVEPTLKALGFEVGNITYIDHIGEDEVRGLRYKGKAVKAGDRLEKTSVIDLVLGNGKGSYRDAFNDDNDDTDG